MDLPQALDQVKVLEETINAERQDTDQVRAFIYHCSLVLGTYQVSD